MEIWKDIKGYEGLYQISNLGNVRSLERIVIRGNIKQHRKERIMNKRENKDGYYIAKLNVNKKSTSIPIHRLVAMAFIPNPNNYPEVNHIDCDRKNNFYKNLEWCTHNQNISHSVNLAHYKKPYGENNPNFGNRKLHDRYLNEPNLAKLQSRPREKNGRSKKIAMYDDSDNLIEVFDYIGGCAKFLINNNISKSKNINTVRDFISKSIKYSRKYKGYNFKFI